MADRYASLKQGLVGCWIPSISGSGLLLPDLSGRGNNGALTGMDASDWVSASYGRALDFDGVNDVVSCPQVPFTGTGNFSISLWVLQATIRASDHAIKFGTATLNNAVGIFNSSGNNLAIGLHANNASEASLTGNLATNVFYHVVGTCTPTRREIWLNGVLQGTSTTTVNYDITSTFCNIGAAQSTLVPWNGRLDDIRVYSRVLTESEIRLLASEPGIGFKPAKKLSRFSQRFTYKPAKPRNYSVIRNRDPNYSTLRHGLVAAYCPSISGQGNVLPDLVGGNHGTLTNMDASDWVASGDGRALDFDGSNDYVAVNDNSALSPLSEISIAFWARPAALPAASNGNRMWIVTKGNTSNFEYECAINSFSANFGKWTFVYYSADGISYRERASTVSAVANEWQHICWTAKRDGSLPDVYVNGVLNNGASGTDGTATPIDGTAQLQIGRRANGTDKTWNGQLDDLRLYSRALTEPEIKLLASKRGIGLEPRKPKITFTDLGVQKTYSVVRVKETDYATLRQGLVGAWCPSLPNGGSGNTLPDVSGYGNHGSLVGMDASDWVSGQYGRALDFDGVNDKVADIGSTSSFSFIHTSGVLSIAFWAKIDTDGTRLTVAGNTLSSAEKGFLILRESLANYGIDVMRCVIYAGASGTFAVAGTTNDAVALAGTWDHWCYTSNYKNTTGQWYKNGIAVTTTTRFNPADISLGSLGLGDSTRKLGLGIGTFSSDLIPLDGQLDDFRIYNRALSEPEIRLLASRPGIGLRQESHRQTFYQFPSGARRKRILTGMP